MLKNFILTTITFLVIDFIWLGLVAKNFYDQHLAAFNRHLNLPAAFATYFLLIAGIVFLVLPKADGNLWQALLWGAVFGLITYGVYDLTNLATLADWSLTMVFVDMAWGAFLCGSVSFVVSWLLASI